MRRGIGHYIRKGLGGASSAARRFGGSSRTAGSLYGALTGAAGRLSALESALDPALLAGRSADEVMDAVVEAVRPVDGTQDTEASRKAIHTALADLLGRFPGADLLSLTEDQRLFVIERYLALDVYHRLHLDVGKVIQAKAPSISTALARLRQIREYLRETIAARFRALLVAGESISARRIAHMAAQALRETFEVFEEFVR